ncbi:MAG: hypothetical protein EOO86_03385 [Pedobacter sp.]|nr:MAG: hypothetical protein EOO86_03385 [Pedobacter sp.]
MTNYTKLPAILLLADGTVFYGKAGKQATESIQDYFQNDNLVAISDIDTRALVRHIRDKGAMNAIISSEITDLEELKQKLSEVPSMDGLELSSKVSTKEPYFYGNPDASLKVAALDLGIKKNILRSFENRDIYVQVFPAKTKFSEMEKFSPDGVKGKKAFSVQYHPESSPGPHDSRYLFDDFVNVMKGELVW